MYNILGDIAKYLKVKREASVSGGFEEVVEVEETFVGSIQFVSGKATVDVLGLDISNNVIEIFTTGLERNEVVVELGDVIEFRGSRYEIVSKTPYRSHLELYAKEVV